MLFFVRFIQPLITVMPLVSNSVARRVSVIHLLKDSKMSKFLRVTRLISFKPKQKRSQTLLPVTLLLPLTMWIFPGTALADTEGCSLSERYIALAKKEEANFNKREALGFYQRAAEDCPSYEAWQRVGELAATFDETEVVRSAFQAFSKAYELAPDAASLAVTKAHYAQLSFIDGDRSRGVDLIFEARNLNPDNQWIASVADSLLSESAVLSSSDVKRGLGSDAWAPPPLRAGVDLADGAKQTSGGASPVAVAVQSPPVKREAVIQAQFSFLTGTTELDRVTQPNVSTLAGALASADYATKRFQFVGHADVRGEAETNLRLSRLRAEAIRDQVLALEPGLAGRIEVQGRGEEEPRSFGLTAADHRANRRLEIRLLP